jgi:TPR repeat protein
MTSVFRVRRHTRGMIAILSGLLVFAAVSVAHIHHVIASEVAPPGQEIAAAVDLIKDGETQKGFDTFIALAKEGNPHAMYHLGAIYHSGMLGEPELSKATPWYQQAADAGVLEAQFALGSLYYKGKGVPKDLGRALRYFSSAAESGLLAAQYNLAMMHTAGLAHSKEYNADQDRQRAYKWFTVVLARIDPDADTSQIHDAMKLLGEEMTTIEIDQGKKMAEEWLAANPVVSK